MASILAIISSKPSNTPDKVRPGLTDPPIMALQLVWLGLRVANNLLSPHQAKITWAIQIVFLMLLMSVVQAQAGREFPKVPQSLFRTTIFLWLKE